MKRYHQTLTLTCCLLTGILIAGSCRKEKTPEPSNLDKNYFIIEDNPNDHIDHAIYLFYQNTGIAAFYNDTIYKKKVSRKNETPDRFAYIKLSLSYSPFGNSLVYSEPLTSKENIPALLNLLMEQVVPVIPSNMLLPSILFLDSLADGSYKKLNTETSHGWTSLSGFNTVGIKVENAAAMNTDERNMYAASILAGIAAQKVNDLFAVEINKSFLSISRDIIIKMIPYDIYLGLPIIVFPDPQPIPEEIGFLFYPKISFGMPLDGSPRPADDIRAYLTAIFYFTEQEFSTLHANHPPVLKKFSIMRNFVKAAGFKLPE